MVSDYVLDATSKTVAAAITPKALSIGTAVANNKTYDAGTTATISAIGSLSGFIGSETVTAIATNGTFSDKNVGTGKTVTVDYQLTDGVNGGLASNYSLVNTTTIADIITKAITVTGTTASSKVFDSGLVATINTALATLTNGASAANDNQYYSTDNVVLVKGFATGNYVTNEVGTNKLVMVSGYALSGVDAGNYTVSDASNVHADISAVPVVDAIPYVTIAVEASASYAIVLNSQSLVSTKISDQQLSFNAHINIPGAYQAIILVDNVNQGAVFSATNIDHSSLPLWIQINSATGTFVATPPSNINEIDVFIKALLPSGKVLIKKEHIVFN